MVKKQDRLEQVKLSWEKGLGVTEIGKELKISSGYACKLLHELYGKGNHKRHIYKRRLFTLNEHFFEEINTEAKAYFLGLLAADGNLTKGQNLVRIGLQEKDKAILECFNKHLEYTRPLKLVKKVKEPGWNRSNQYKIEVSSTIFRRSLEKHGLTPNKSLTLELTNTIPEELFHHYLRGYFDGDGCIYVSKLNQASISFSCSNIFCDQLIKKIEKYEIILRKRKHITANVYYALTNGNKKVLKFYEFLYKDATIFLERKKEKFDNWINKRNIKYGNSRK